MNALRTPDEALVLEHLDKLHADPDFEGTEAALRTLFARMPKNDQFDEVLPKVVTLNTLYSAGLRFIELHPVARHICQLGIDERLQAGDLDVVTDIATPSKGEPFRVSYSFATKYCNFHRPEVFAIYDQYVDCQLWEYQQANRFARFFRYQLRSYRDFYRILDEFVAHYKLEQFTRKEIDKFLWLYGMKRHKPVGPGKAAAEVLPSDVIAEGQS